jgi:hypothetical protein
MKDTFAAIGGKMYDGLEKKQSLKVRYLLLIGVLPFVFGMLVGRMQKINSPLTSVKEITDVNAVFIDNPQTEDLEKWVVNDSVIKYDYEEGLLFLIVEGGTEGPFFVTKAQ